MTTFGALVRGVVASSLLSACAAHVAPDWVMARRACAVREMHPPVSRQVTLGQRENVERSDGETENIVLITIDGARWQEVFGGVDPVLAEAASIPAAQQVWADQLLPNLARLAERGATVGAPCSGAPMLTANGAHVSLPGYLEILTGEVDPGCQDNHCPRVKRPTLLDEIRDQGHRSATEIALIASWENLAFAAASSSDGVVVTAGRTSGVNRAELRRDPISSHWIDAGSTSSPAPGHDDYRPDALTAPLALHFLATHHPRFLHIALGDPDELAHASRYTDYLSALRYADGVVGSVLEILDRGGEWGERTSLFVTTDHGRASNFHSHGASEPESARVWLIAGGGAIPALGRVWSERPTYLADIAPTIRSLLGLRTREGLRVGRTIEALAPVSHDERRANR